LADPADNIPVDAPHRERSYQVRPDPRRHKPRPTLRPQDTLAGVNRILSQTSVQPSTPRGPSPARAPKLNTGIAFALAPLRLERLRWRRCNRPDPGCASGGRALEVAQIDARVPRKRHRRRFRVRAPAIVGTLAKRLDAPSWRLRLELHESAREPAWEGGGVSGSRHRAVAHEQYAGRPCPARITGHG
jgi:hypothetical protein